MVKVLFNLNYAQYSSNIPCEIYFFHKLRSRFLCMFLLHTPQKKVSLFDYQKNDDFFITLQEHQFYDHQQS